MLKHTIDSLDGLDAAIAALYKQVGDKYVLQVEGLPDTTALQNAFERQKQTNVTLRTENESLKTEIATHESTIEGIRKGVIPKGDVDALEASWKGKLTKTTEEKDAEIARLNSGLHNLLVGNVARDLAGRVVAKPESSELVLPHITRRLRVEVVDGEPVTRVLDKNGQPSAMTLDELEREVLESPTFAPIVKGTGASGGNARGGNSGNPGAKKFSEMNEAERTEYARKDPAGFRKALADSRSAKA